MDEALYLLCRVSSSWLALPADAIEAVAPMSDVVPVPHAPHIVAGVVAIRSRLLTLIDLAILAGEQTDIASPAPLMVIISVDGHGYGLLVDEVDDVIPLGRLAPTPGNVSVGWRRLSSSIADHRGRVLMIVKPADVIASAQFAPAHAA